MCTQFSKNSMKFPRNFINEWNPLYSKQKEKKKIWTQKKKKLLRKLEEKSHVVEKIQQEIFMWDEMARNNANLQAMEFGAQADSLKRKNLESLSKFSEEISSEKEKNFG